MQKPNCTEQLHVDTTITRSFQTELFLSFLPSTYAGKGNLAAAKHWQLTALLNSLFFVFKILFMPKYPVIYYDYIVKWCNLTIIELAMYVCMYVSHVLDRKLLERLMSPSPKSQAMFASAFL